MLQHYRCRHGDYHVAMHHYYRHGDSHVAMYGLRGAELRRYLLSGSLGLWLGIAV